VFLFRLAAALGWSVAQICRDMDSRELSEWMAVHRFFMPLPDPWMQTGVLASAAVAPYSSKGHAPKPTDFVPIEKPPQHQLELEAQIRLLAQALGKANG
jgi:hypothetical protein